MSASTPTTKRDGAGAGASARFSYEPIPTAPCPTCGGRAWRLRGTQAADGAWLWACATCADRLGGVAAAWPAEAPLATVDEEDPDAGAGATAMEGLFGAQDGIY